MKLPSFQFYPGDWMKDPNLRRCSRAARGMWVDMLCLMFECEDRGVLSTGGEPWSDEDISAAIGGDTADGLACIAELLRKGVARRNQAGAIFSKRMVADEQIRKERAKAGGKGGSKTQAKLKQTSKQKPTPSSSSSDSVPNGTGASAPPFADADIIWKVGVILLQRDGTTEKNARSHLGKLAGEYGNGTLAAAVATTSAANPVNPREYLEGVLKNNGHGRRRSQAEINRAGNGMVE